MEEKIKATEETKKSNTARYTLRWDINDERHHDLMPMLRVEKGMTPRFEVMTSIIGIMALQSASYLTTGNADVVAVVDIIFII